MFLLFSLLVSSILANSKACKKGNVFEVFPYGDCWSSDDCKIQQFGDFSQEREVNSFEKTIVTLQQLEIIIRRNSLENSILIRENYVEFERHLLRSLADSNEKFFLIFLELKDDLINSITDYINNFIKSVSVDLEKLISDEIIQYKDLNSDVLRENQSSLTSVISSVGSNLDPLLVPNSLLNSNSTYNLKMTGIIANAGLSSYNAGRATLLDLTKSAEIIIQNAKDDLNKQISSQVDFKIVSLTKVFAFHIEEIIKSLNLLIFRHKEVLVVGLERTNLRSFEMAKFSIDISKGVAKKESKQNLQFQLVQPNLIASQLLN
jgi:hypothetical protein